MIIFPASEVTFAHEGDQAEKIAPDLHPLIVLGEFLVIFYAGYWIANHLSRIGSKEE
jgi:hypothetical protein